jgi:hypothetical protein
MKQMVEWMFYSGAFLVAALILAVFYVIIVDFFVLKLSGKTVIDEKQSSFITVPVMTIWIIGIFVIPFFILKSFGIDPPLEKNKIIIGNITDQSKVVSLNGEIKKINNTLSNIDNLTINQIQTELARTRDFVNKLKEEAELQNKLINDLKLQAYKFKTEADSASKIAQEIKALNQNQLSAVRYLLTEDADIKNTRSFWIGALISFPIGLMTSVLGNYFWGIIKRRLIYSIKEQVLDA